MAFLELTKEKNPKLAIQVNNSLKYQDKDGNLQDRQKVTALIDVVKEAGIVASMDKGVVSLSLNTQDGYKNYFVNKTKSDDIALVPMDKELQKNKDEIIYFNKKQNENNPNQHYYYMSKSGNSEKTLESIKTIDTDKSSYLGARVTLSNKELLQEMSKFEADTGEKAIATIGKNSQRIETLAELQAQRSEAQTQTKEIPVEIKDKGGNIVDKSSLKKTVENKEIETIKKKPFKPKEKTVSKGQDRER